MFRPPTPTTTPKLQLDFFDLKSSWSLGVVVGGGVGSGATTTTPKLNWTFLDLEKWLFMPEICDDILLLPVGNYSLDCYSLFIFQIFGDFLFDRETPCENTRSFL